MVCIIVTLTDLGHAWTSCPALICRKVPVAIFTMLQRYGVANVTVTKLKNEQEPMLANGTVSQSWLRNLAYQECHSSTWMPAGHSTTKELCA